MHTSVRWTSHSIANDKHLEFHLLNNSTHTHTHTPNAWCDGLSTVYLGDLRSLIVSYRPWDIGAEWNVPCIGHNSKGGSNGHFKNVDPTKAIASSMPSTLWLMLKIVSRMLSTVPNEILEVVLKLWMVHKQTSIGWIRDDMLICKKSWPPSLHVTRLYLSLSFHMKNRIMFTYRPVYSLCMLIRSRKTTT